MTFKKILEEKGENLKIVIPDDYQDVVKTLDCFSKLAGHEVKVLTDLENDLKSRAEKMKGAEVLVLIRERTKITGELLDLLPGLKLISQTGKSMPHIDLEACTRHGVAVAGGTPSLSPGLIPGSSASTAELTWGLILASLRRLPREIAALKAGRWQTTLGTGLKGRTLGIFGYGNIGKQVANYGRAFGMEILIWGREKSLKGAKLDGFETARNQEDLFIRSDVLSLHISLGPETKGIIKREDLARMKTSALFVNTSRAGLVENGAIVEALKAGRPGFGAFDVFEEEPVIDHPLLHLENALCTPHLGYVEKDSYESFFGRAFELILAYSTGKPANIVNPEVLPKF